MQWNTRRSSRRLLPIIALVMLPAALPAVQPSTDRTGQVLLYPLVSQGGRFDTLMTLSNHHELVPTAVRVNVRHGQSGDEPASLNLFLDAGETFAAAFTGGRLEVVTDTCMQSKPAATDGGGSIDIGTVDSAFLEVIEMGTMEATHGVPTGPEEETSCPETRDDYAEASSNGELAPPQGQLVGASYLIDVPQGLSFPLPPVALERFRDAPLFTAAGNRHPNLNDASPAESVLLGDFRPAGSDVPVLRSSWRHPVDAVSAALSAAVAETDFSVEPGLSAATDVILTFPTRHYYVGVQDDREREPFVTHYVRTDVVDPIEEPGQQFLVIARNRAGETAVPVFGRDVGIFDAGFGKRAKCSPALPNAYPGPLLTGSQIDIHVGEEPLLPVAAVHEARQVALPDQCSVVRSKPVRELFDAGKLWFDFAAYETESLEGHVHYGLPVIGASLTAFANETTTLANYGLVHPLRIERDAAYPSASVVPAAGHLATDPVASPIYASPPTISGDGNVVAWATENPLAGGDDDDGNDIYLLGGEQPPSNVSPDLGEHPEEHYLPVLSANGEWVASNTCMLVPTGSNSARCEPEIRLASLGSGEVTRIQSAPGARVKSFRSPMVSNDGSRIAFVAEGSDGIHVDLYERSTGQSRRVISDVTGLFDMGSSGNWILFGRDAGEGEARQRLFYLDLGSGEEVEIDPLLPPVDPDYGVGFLEGAAMSEDRRYLTFSYDSGLSGVFWLDRQTGRLERLDVSHDGVAFNGTDAPRSELSGDGRTVLFSVPSRLLPGVPRGSTQLYRWTPEDGLALASVTPAGAAGDGHSGAVDVNTDGLRFAYITSAVDIAPGTGSAGKNHVDEYRLIRAAWPDE